MTLRWVVGIALGMAAVVARPAEASDNVFGTTGLITIPTANVLAPREVQAHVHDAEDFLSYGASLGVFPGLEIGGTLIKGDSIHFTNSKGKTVAVVPDNVLGVNGATELVVNAKYQVLREHSFVPAVAVGATDLF